MTTHSKDAFILHPEVAAALREQAPIVALETAVVTHGLPRPLNLELATDVEAIIRHAGAVPATIGMISGRLYGGLTHEQLNHLAVSEHARKISQRDFGSAMATGSDGGTTVAGTAIAANRMGIRVFATGGIGGVHREAPFDVSADLTVLSRVPIIVVCAGAKAILDLPATMEYLETMGIPVLGYQTEDFPAFYSTSSGLKVSQMVGNAEMVAEISRQHASLGLASAILVVVPPPADLAIPSAEIEQHIQTAVGEAHKQGISGSAMTPFLLGRMSELTSGRSLSTNLALLKNNARVAAEIAVAISRKDAHLSRV